MAGDAVAGRPGESSGVNAVRARRLLGEPTRLRLGLSRAGTAGGLPRQRRCKTDACQNEGCRQDHLQSEPGSPGKGVHGLDGSAQEQRDLGRGVTGSASQQGGALPWAQVRALRVQPAALGMVADSVLVAGDGLWLHAGVLGELDFAGGSLRYDAQSDTVDYDAGPTSGAGTAGWFTSTDYAVTDKLSAKVNVATGNLHLAVTGPSVPGIGGDRTAGLNFNSLSQVPGATEGLSTSLGIGWRLSDTPGERMVTYPDGSVRHIDASGRAAVYRKTGTTFVSPPGEGATSLTLSGAEYVLTKQPSRQVTRFRTSDGLMVSDTDRNGVAYAFSYPTSEHPAVVTGTRGAGNPLTFALNARGRVTSLNQTADGVARSTRMTYDAAGDRLTAVTDANNAVTTFGWTGNDITNITAPGGAVTTITYDTSHRVRQVVRDAGTGRLNATWTWDYTAKPRLTLAKAPNAVSSGSIDTTTYTRDVFGKVSSVADPLGNLQDVKFNANNDVMQAVDGLGGVRDFEFGPNFMPTSAKSPTGASASATYTGPSPFQPDSGTDSQGNVTALEYDSRGNPTKSSGGGVTTSATYNPGNGAAMVCGGKPGQQCSNTDGNSQATNYAYDTGGNLTTATPPAGSTLLPAVTKGSSYTYYESGQTRTVTDGTGKVSTNVYDPVGRLLETRYDGITTCTATNISADQCIKYTYNPDGSLANRRDRAGLTTYGYDGAGRQTSQGLATANAGAATPVTMTYDPSGNLLSVTDAAGTIGYAYDSGNNLIRLTEPGGSCTDTAGLPYDTEKRPAPATSGCVTYKYNENDKRVATRFPGGQRQDSAYDAAGRATTVRGGLPAPATPVMEFLYSYNKGVDAAGKPKDTGLVQTRTDTLPAVDLVQTHDYDPLNRLTRTTERSASTVTALWAYCYDGAGNRTYDSTSLAAPTACPGQAGGPAATAFYDATNALRARGTQPAPNNTFTYDGNGNETAAVGINTRTGGAYNAKNQLTNVITGTPGTTIPHTFTYAGSSQNERTTADGTRYRNTPLGLTAQVSPALTIIREPGGAPVSLRTGGASFYYLKDNQGSVISLVDTAGTERNHYSYDPYGITRSATGTLANPLLYTGGYLDAATGLYKLGIRYYDPVLGRFTQTDPTGQDPHYTYAGGNPVNGADPTGADTETYLGYASTATGALAFGLAFTPLAPASGALGVASAALSGAASAFECSSDEDEEGSCAQSLTSTGISLATFGQGSFFKAAGAEAASAVSDATGLLSDALFYAAD